MKKINWHLVEQDFNKITNYDAERDMYYFERRFRKLLSVLPQDKSIKILDFGCGSGLFSYELSKRGYNNIYLVDNSEVQLKQAQGKGLKNIFYFNHNNNLPFENNFFDFTLLLDLIEHLEDPYG